MKRKEFKIGSHASVAGISEMKEAKTITIFSLDPFDTPENFLSPK